MFKFAHPSPVIFRSGFVFKQCKPRQTVFSHNVKSLDHSSRDMAQDMARLRFPKAFRFDEGSLETYTNLPHHAVLSLCLFMRCRIR
jgi:hypothetical protein